jgi:drug/metabolite transporter (DMT)-like permease
MDGTRTAAAEHTVASSSTDWLLVAAPGIIWGASFLFIAEGLKSVAPNGITFIRIFIGFATLALFPGARKPIERSAWAGIAVLGVLWFAFPLSMFPFAEQHVSSALTGMLNAVTPLFAAIVAAIIARKLPSSRVAFGVLTGIFGSVLIALPSFHEGRSSALGVVLILFACASYGFALNLARPLQQKYGALPVIWRALGIAALVTAPLGLPEVATATWKTGPLFSLLTLGVAGTGVAFVLIGMAAGRVGATRASAAAFLIPPISLLLGVAMRGEHVALLSIIGSVICIAGAWIIRPRPSKPQGTPQREVINYEQCAATRN